jgi:uncharacterized membrane protein
MGKHQRNIKAAKGGNLQRFEQSEVFDDNLLPDANEIEKLHLIDPDIIHWLKNRAEKEQDFRHKAYENRTVLVDKSNRRDHNTSRLALIIYFLLVLSCVAASFFLIREGHRLQGSIFGGAAALLALAVLITRRQPKKQE